MDALRIGQLPAMPALSQRAQALVDAPPLAEYILEHFRRAEDGYHPDTRPDGYIPLCIAENARRTDDLLGRLHRYVPQVTTGSLGYDAMVGNVTFRRHLADYLGRAFLGRTFAPEHLVVLAGAGTILEQLFFTLGDPGDAVLVPTPSYAGFWADLETRDDLLIHPVHRREEDGFALTVEGLERAYDACPRPVKALLFTNPDNPLGHVASAEAVGAVYDWAVDKGIHVVFDEIYALTAFGERPFRSIASVRPSLGENAHIVWAFSKDFGASGLRCGVLVSENEAVVRAVDQLAYWGACSGHSQQLLSAFVNDADAVDAFVSDMRDDLRLTYRRLTTKLDEAGIRYLEADACFFLLCDLRDRLEAPTFEAEHTLWRRLLDEAAVNLTPGRACRIPEPGFFRLCYAGIDDQALDVALDRIRTVL